MRLLLTLLLAALASRASAARQTSDWGQADPSVVQAVFEKVEGAARRENPASPVRLQILKSYLAEGEAPAALSRDGDGRLVLRLGRAALDAAQSEGELAFMLAHEVRHAVRRASARQCLERGRAALGEAVDRAPEAQAYRLDLEREADEWGQRYAASAGYSAFAAVDAVRHVGELSRTLGAESDWDHESPERRERRLAAYGAQPPFEAGCPWPGSAGASTAGAR